MARRRSLWILLSLLLCAALGAITCTLFAWNARLAWTVPLALPGGARLHLRVAPLLRMASAPWGRRLLDHTVWHTRAGTVTVAERDRHLRIVCADCSLHLPQFAQSPIRIRALSMTLQRDGDHLSGVLSAVESDTEQSLHFNGALSDTGLRLNWVLPTAKLSGLFGLLHTAVPEARDATIFGSLAATGTLQLPAARWTAQPVLQGFEVYGLGTEGLRYGAFRLNCRKRDGTPEQRLAGDGAPGWLTLDQMGRWLPRAVLAAEDARYYKHAGFDLDELLPLLADAERSGRRGASTITQQLAKNFFVGAEATGARKLRELLYSVEMERTLGKRRILALYLNTVDWGPGLCGATGASQTYFGHSPARLAPAEAAWLAGIIRNPHRAYRKEFVGRHVDQERLASVLAGLPGRVRGNRHLAFREEGAPLTPIATGLPKPYPVSALQQQALAGPDHLPVSGGRDRRAE